MNGSMIWREKRIEVTDVRVGAWIELDGVRAGWDATDRAFGSRMFYPSDMFTFEPGCG